MEDPSSEQRRVERDSDDCENFWRVLNAIERKKMYILRYIYIVTFLSPEFKTRMTELREKS